MYFSLNFIHMLLGTLRVILPQTSSNLVNVEPMSSRMITCTGSADRKVITLRQQQCLRVHWCLRVLYNCLDAIPYFHIFLNQWTTFQQTGAAQ